MSAANEHDDERNPWGRERMRTTVFCSMNRSAWFSEEVTSTCFFSRTLSWVRDSKPQLHHELLAMTARSLCAEYLAQHRRVCAPHPPPIAHAQPHVDAGVCTDGRKEAIAAYEEE